MFRVMIAGEDRENNDKIYVPMSPNQIKSLINKLNYLLENNPEICSDGELSSSKSQLTNNLHEAIKYWETLIK